MQIFEVTKKQDLQEAIPGLGDLVMGGLARAMGSGQADPLKSTPRDEFPSANITLIPTIAMMLS
jgi:hypothetical protein